MENTISDFLLKGTIEGTYFSSFWCQLLYFGDVGCQDVLEVNGMLLVVLKEPKIGI